jgi:hypothetical protein
MLWFKSDDRRNLMKFIKNLSTFLKPYNYHPFFSDYLIFKEFISTKKKGDREHIQDSYSAVFDREVDLINPRTFNEKLQLRKIKPNIEYSLLADKFSVRKYVRDLVGEQCLIKLYGVYNNASEIDYANLPDKFVLKCTHDSGSIVICDDKDKCDFKKINRFLDYNLKRNYYHRSREKHYSSITPKIICERFLCDNGNLPIDYKIHVFKSKIFIQCDTNRFCDIKRSFYDEDWNLLPFNKSIINSESIVKVPKPQNLLLMKKYAKLLTGDSDYMRVDFYELSGNLYFGEITVTPCSGLGRFYPDEIDYIWGELME